MMETAISIIRKNLHQVVPWWRFNYLVCRPDGYWELFKQFPMSEDERGFRLERTDNPDRKRSAYSIEELLKQCMHGDNKLIATAIVLDEMIEKINQSKQGGEVDLAYSDLQLQCLSHAKDVVLYMAYNLHQDGMEEPEVNDGQLELWTQDAVGNIVPKPTPS